MLAAPRWSEGDVALRRQGMEQGSSKPYLTRPPSDFTCSVSSLRRQQHIPSQTPRMSTQNPDAGIQIAIQPETDLQHCRLLELPAELLTLVTSANPPTFVSLEILWLARPWLTNRPRLYLKSKENIDGSVKDANAVLCTADKTYNIRQVSTSNTVYLTQPVERPDEGGGIPNIGVDAVVKCDSTLELIAAPKQSAVSYIKAALPVFTSTGTHSSQKVSTKADLFCHIPLSDAECEESWTDLACFESAIPELCAIPSAKVKVEVWQRILNIAVADGTLFDPFIANDIPAFALDLTGDYPEELILAILAAVSAASPGGNLVVNEDRCVRFVGLSQLEARCGGRATETASFLEAWKDTVPEAWRSKCDLSVLKDSHALQEGGSYITFVEAGASGSTAATSAPADAKVTLGAKRKWHEKFRPSKKT